MSKLIHLVFKTHLDIGFTDHAAKVRQQYHEQFIPQAIATGEHFFAENPNEPQFIWTTGAWLIWDHLASQPADKVKRLERAIERGLIAWHGLPFTTHTELMSPAVFRAGLSYGQELDQRFGRQTIAAKMTDVPGHTLGMVPLLAEAGIRFLHLGVNTASPVPDVPPIFVWRAPDGAEIVVMYQGSYGETDFPLAGELGLSFAHTNDNIGPQSVGQTIEALRALRHAHPDATIKASTLDTFGARMWDLRRQLPVVTQEIGDSWIHGAASDPHKLARFRALQRLYDDFASDLTPERLAFGRELAMVAEHTWGIDIKTYLRDETAWDRPRFEPARAKDYRFAFAEQSWTEQRQFLDTAIAALSPPDQVRAAAATMAPAASGLSDGGWRADCDPITGDIVRLASPTGAVLEGSGALFAYRYESYDWAELQRHLDSYLQHRIEWAILDHDKPGLQHAKTAQTAVFAPYYEGDGMALMPAVAHDELGAPKRIGFALHAISETQVEISLTLRGKPANRMPEASFLHFTPHNGINWQFEKLGLWLDAGNVVARGGGQLQAVSALRTTISGGHLTATLLDCALVAPAAADFMPFAAAPPDYADGVRINIHNNKWGTNFPMWCEGDLVCRIVLELGTP
jgi:hypothetical protein